MMQVNKDREIGIMDRTNSSSGGKPKREGINAMLSFYLAMGVSLVVAEKTKSGRP